MLRIDEAPTRCGTTDNVTERSKHMHINIKHQANRTVVHIEGVFLSEPDQEKFRAQIKEIISAGEKHVIVDLSRVEHINSCGLGSLVCGLVAARQAGGDLSLMNPAAGVLRLLEITKLNTAFRIYPSVMSALAGDRLSHN